ncbi:hypothetical protein [Cupriavidus plantarum]|uniref:hypothetical protein n=1 Tax=Cupriavidus plantarum TaxID=942865 RepID=UPI0011C43C88|nr:hypothetical protein [Cupriavidus plantarum]
MINIGTFVITLYLFVHFTWYAWEAFAEWRLRLTGTKVAFKTTAILASEDGDYPDEPRQSTLHYWWVTQARAISGVPAAVEELRNLIGEVRTHIQAAPREGPYDGETLRRMGSVENVIGKLEKNMRAFEDVVNSNRVPVSLERFEAWHKLFVESQSIRWLVIDVGIPWILGLSALLTLGCAFLR